MRRALGTRLAVAVWILAVSGCNIFGGGDDGNNSSTPTSPTPGSGTTRVISVSGNLTFGTVSVGNQRTLNFTITNNGNATLTVTSLTVDGGLIDHSSASWTEGQVGPGASQSVNITFAPTTAGTFSGTITVVGNQTSGTNTISISGTGVFGFDGAWAGSYVVDRFY